MFVWQVKWTCENDLDNKKRMKVHFVSTNVVWQLEHLVQQVETELVQPPSLSEQVFEMSSDLQ